LPAVEHGFGSVYQVIVSAKLIGVDGTCDSIKVNGVRGSGAIGTGVVVFVHNVAGLGINKVFPPFQNIGPDGNMPYQLFV
jgi:hypothetical protein